MEILLKVLSHFAPAVGITKGDGMPSKHPPSCIPDYNDKLNFNI